jgi:tRNA dimethylallyltransferase
VRGLHARPGLHAGLPALRSVGYRQLWAHLDGECDLPAAIDGARAATRQLAKRQFTWLRKWPDLRWILTDSAGHVVRGDGETATPPAKSPTEVALHYLPGGAMK